MAGKLTLVATPIGNLEDITLRALRTLKEAGVIFAEDTRHTTLLLNHYGIKKPMHSCHQGNEDQRTREIVERVQRGENVALVSDAGSPGISDPGFRVVRACVAQGLKVETTPGPCALIAALSASGLPTHEFHFVGFLPTKPGPRERKLQELVALSGTLVFYESPHRAVRTLEQMARIFPGQKVVVARELTKKFEEYRRGTSEEILAWIQNHPPRGEFVILVGRREIP